MDIKNKLRKRIIFMLMTVSLMVTPIYADKRLESGTDFSIKIKGVDNNSDLPTDSSNPNDKNVIEEEVSGKLPATGQGSSAILTACIFVVCGTCMLIRSKEKCDKNEDA